MLIIWRSQISRLSLFICIFSYLFFCPYHFYLSFFHIFAYLIFTMLLSIRTITPRLDEETNPQKIYKIAERPLLVSFSYFNMSYCHTSFKDNRFRYWRWNIMWEGHSISSNMSPMRKQLNPEPRTLSFIPASPFSKEVCNNSHAGWTLGRAGL